MEEGELDVEDGEERARQLMAEAEEEEHIAALQRALSLPDLLTAPLVVAEADPSPVVAATETEGGAASVNLWPQVLEEVDSTAVPDWPDLSSGGPEVEAWMRRHQQVLVRTVTWNLAGNKPPEAEETLGRLFPTNRYHVCVVGTEECERSIAASALNPSKRHWEEYLCTVMGKQYVPLRSHTLQAIHAMVFVHVGIAHLCSDITSAAIATGIANTLGNKGGVAISMRIAGTKFVFANAHLAAHQNAVKQRNAEYAKLCRELPLLLAKKEKTPLMPPPASSSSAPSSSSSSSSSTSAAAAEAAPQTDTNFKTPSPTPNPSPAGPGFESCADRVVFMGDLNYRVRGNRQAVDKLLLLGMHDVLLANDQLRWSMRQGLVLGSFVGACRARSGEATD